MDEEQDKTGENPHESPEAGSSKTRQDYPIARVCFWISVTIGALGQIISFYPGSELPWFALAAVLAIQGVVIPKRTFRIASLAIMLLWSAIAFSGYIRGKQYERRLKQNPPEKRIRELEEQIKLMESSQGVTP